MSLTSTLLAKTPAPLLVEPGVLPPTKSVLVFSQKIVYYDVGSGPTVVLLHGLASQAMFDWGRVIMPLSQRHRVIALDQIGFGESDKPTIDYSSEICEQGRNDFHKYSQFNFHTMPGPM